MATNYFGLRKSATPIITGAGLLHGLIFSHNQATVQTLTLYDNTAASGTILLQAYVSAAQTPYYLFFPRRYAIPFTTGLSFPNNLNHELTIWATDLD
jgi:hypothetical protein